MKLPKPSSAMPQFRVVVVVARPGETDFADTGELRYALAEASADAEVVVVDMTANTFCDASIINVLDWGRQRMHENGGELRVACRTPQILRWMAITEQDRPFQIYPNLRAAVKVDRWHVRFSHQTAA
jgi:anti-anti-sigma factor